MGRRAVPIDEQISRQEAGVLAMKKKYDASVEKLAKLVDKKKELESKGIVFDEPEITYAPHVFPPKGSTWILFRGPDNEHIELNELM